MNQALALKVLQQMMEAGVREFCVCPGARNSPLVDLLLQLPQAKKFHFFEERSAAFFALGRIKATDHSVAIVTTSGTAAGELLPATMEAYYSALPLVLLTADRPRRFRGSGAPQTAEQVGIFGIYAEKSLDLAAGESLDLTAWSRVKPLHLNVCFEEPLLDSSAEDALRDFASRALPALQPHSPLSASTANTAEDMRTQEIENFLARTQNPLVIVGALHPSDRPGVRMFLEAYGAPAYFEAHSGLREDHRLAPLRVSISDAILERARTNGYAIDAVLRIGGVPTLRLWRDLEILEGKIPVCSVSREPFSGLSWSQSGSKNQCTAPGPLFEKLSHWKRFLSQGSCEAFLSADHALQEQVRALFHEEPRSEPALFHALSRAIPRESRIFVGNSLPIRQWDLAATYSSRDFELAASRGLNGIDGQVSTFYGFAQEGVENWGILGDLTTLYDLPGPWILPQLPSSLRTSLVVVNNKGGKIFSRMFGPAEFQNPHRLDFSAWAKLWNLSYEAWDAVPEQATSPKHHRIIELLPENGATQRFWKAYETLWRAK